MAWEPATSRDDTEVDGTDVLSITPPPTEIVEQVELVLSNKYIHVVTAAEADSTANWTISFPPPTSVQGPDYLILNSSYCLMKYGDHYLLSDDGRTITIKYDTVEFEAGDIIEIYV